MQSKLEYDLVEEEGWFNLLGSVRKMISDGWRPQGGVSSRMDLDDEGTEMYMYAQAMVRDAVPDMDS